MKKINQKIFHKIRFHYENEGTRWGLKHVRYPIVETSSAAAFEQQQTSNVKSDVEFGRLPKFQTGVLISL